MTYVLFAFIATFRAESEVRKLYVFRAYVQSKCQCLFVEVLFSFYYVFHFLRIDTLPTFILPAVSVAACASSTRWADTVDCVWCGWWDWWTLLCMQICLASILMLYILISTAICININIYINININIYININSKFSPFTSFSRIASGYMNPESRVGKRSLLDRSWQYNRRR